MGSASSKQRMHDSDRNGTRSCLLNLEQKLQDMSEEDKIDTTVKWASSLFKGGSFVAMELMENIRSTHIVGGKMVGGAIIMEGGSRLLPECGLGVGGIAGVLLVDALLINWQLRKVIPRMEEAQADLQKAKDIFIDQVIGEGSCKLDKSERSIFGAFMDDLAYSRMQLQAWEGELEFLDGQLRKAVERQDNERELLATKDRLNIAYQMLFLTLKRQEALGNDLQKIIEKQIQNAKDRQSECWWSTCRSAIASVLSAATIACHFMPPVAFAACTGYLIICGVACLTAAGSACHSYEHEKQIKKQAEGFEGMDNFTATDEFFKVRLRAFERKFAEFEAKYGASSRPPLQSRAYIRPETVPNA